MAIFLNRLFSATGGLILCSVLMGCGGGSGGNNNKKDFTVDLRGAVAIGLKSGASTAQGQGSNDCNLVKFMQNGTSELACADARISGFEDFSGGLVVTVEDLGTYVVLTDGEKFSIGQKSYKGQNENGDLLFSDASIFRMATKLVEPLNTTLTNPSIQSMSGNFAVLRGGNSIYQIFDTVTNARYNINGCNGPRIAAISSSKAIINDCSLQELIDMTNGNRTDVSSIDSFNSETIYQKPGAVVLSTTCPSGSSGNRICRVDEYGVVTAWMSNTTFSIDSTCMNCGDRNKTLFASGNYFVVRELTGVSLVQNNVDAKTPILAAHNVTSVSVKDGVVYYAAEDNFGNPRNGTYTISSSTDTAYGLTVKLTKIRAYQP